MKAYAKKTDGQAEFVTLPLISPWKSNNHRQHPQSNMYQH